MSSKRSCGECCGCCITAPVVPLKKPAGVACLHIIDHNGCGRCGIYESAPSCCHQFTCDWLSDDGTRFSDAERPDKIGVVFETAEIRGPDRSLMVTLACEIEPGSLAAHADIVERMVVPGRIVHHVGADEIFSVNEADADYYVAAMQAMCATGKIEMHANDGTVSHITVSEAKDMDVW